MSTDQTGGFPLNDRPFLILSRIVFQIGLQYLGGLRVAGYDNIPVTGPVLLCPNHTSDLDPVAILAATRRRDLNALGKSELFDIPILGSYFRLIGAVPVHRDSADRAAIRTSEQILGAGRMLLIFPEGRCSPTGKLQAIQSGAILLALRSKAPIIPVGVRGTRNVLPYGALTPKFAGGGVSVTFGKPLVPSAYSGLSHREALRGMNKDLRIALIKLTMQDMTT